jgi:hypothetical protein
MKQVNVGFQFGGKAYREVIFFENQAALDRFKQIKLKFDAQASSGGCDCRRFCNVKVQRWSDGVYPGKGGLMYEASVGGQKFDYSPF